VADLVTVGFLFAGNGRWGHADLGGNVMVWVAGWYNSSCDVPCVNCTNSPDAAARMVRGGSFIFDADFARTSNRFNEYASTHRREIGARCARAAP
jgi:formylglycine-generating enzyme